MTTVQSLDSDCVSCLSLCIYYIYLTIYSISSKPLLINSINLIANCKAS